MCDVERGGLDASQPRSGKSLASAGPSFPPTPKRRGWLKGGKEGGKEGRRSGTSLKGFSGRGLKGLTEFSRIDRSATNQPSKGKEVGAGKGKRKVDKKSVVSFFFA